MNSASKGIASLQETQKSKKATLDQRSHPDLETKRLFLRRWVLGWAILGVSCMMEDSLRHETAPGQTGNAALTQPTPRSMGISDWFRLAPCPRGIRILAPVVVSLDRSAKWAGQAQDEREEKEMSRTRLVLGRAYRYLAPPSVASSPRIGLGTAEEGKCSRETGDPAPRLTLRKAVVVLTLPGVSCCAHPPSPSQTEPSGGCITRYLRPAFGATQQGGNSW